MITIDRRGDDDFPGIVECSFTDANGTCHVIHEKDPVVSDEGLGPANVSPRPGRVACRVLGEVR